MQALTPQDVRDFAAASIPDFVIGAFNELLTKNFRLGYNSIRIDHSEIKEVILPLVSELSGEFKNAWLNVESIYEARGWKVIYHKQSYGDTKPSYFEFIAPPKTGS